MASNDGCRMVWSRMPLDLPNSMTSLYLRYFDRRGRQPAHIQSISQVALKFALEVFGSAGKSISTIRKRLSTPSVFIFPLQRPSQSLFQKRPMLAAVRSIQKPVASTGLRALSVPAFQPDLKTHAAKPKVRGLFGQRVGRAALRRTLLPHDRLTD